MDKHPALGSLGVGLNPGGLIVGWFGDTAHRYLPPIGHFKFSPDATKLPVTRYTATCFLTKLIRQRRGIAGRVTTPPPPPQTEEGTAQGRSIPEMH